MKARLCVCAGKGFGENVRIQKVVSVGAADGFKE